MTTYEFIGNYYFDTIPVDAPPEGIEFGLVYPHSIYRYEQASWELQPDSSYVFTSQNISGVFTYTLGDTAVVATRVNGDYVSILNTPADITVNPFLPGEVVLFNRGIYLLGDDGTTWTPFNNPSVLIDGSRYEDKYGVLYTIFPDETVGPGYAVRTISNVIWSRFDPPVVLDVGQSSLELTGLTQQRSPTEKIVLPTNGQTLINTSFANRLDVNAPIPAQVNDAGTILSVNTLVGVIYPSIEPDTQVYGGNTDNELLRTTYELFRWNGTTSVWETMNTVNQPMSDTPTYVRFRDVYTDIVYQIYMSINTNYLMVGSQEVCGIVSDLYTYNLDPPTSGLPLQIYLTADNVVRFYDTDAWYVVPMAPVFIFRDVRSGNVYRVSTSGGMDRTVIQSGNQLSSAITNRYTLGNFNQSSPPQNLIENDLRTITMEVSSIDGVIPLDPQPPASGWTNSELVAFNQTSSIWELNTSNLTSSDRAATFEYYESGSKITLQYAFQVKSTKKYYYGTLDRTIYTDDLVTGWNTIDSNGLEFVDNNLSLGEGTYKVILEFNYTIDTLVDDALVIPSISVNLYDGVISSRFPTVNFDRNGVKLYGPLQKSSIILSTITNSYPTSFLSVHINGNAFDQVINTSIGDSLTSITVQEL